MMERKPCRRADQRKPGDVFSRILSRSPAAGWDLRQEHHRVELACGHVGFILRKHTQVIEARCSTCSWRLQAPRPIEVSPWGFAGRPVPETGNAKGWINERNVSARMAFFTASFLRFAVPKWIRKWKEEGRPLEEVRAEAMAGGDLIAEKADLIIRGAKGSGEVFNAIAKGLAALSFHPGGVDLFGLHFETRPEELPPTPARAEAVLAREGAVS